MAYNGKEGKPIPLGIAKKWTKNYRDANPGAIKAHFFGKDIINQILQENNGQCEGIRVYYGIDDNGAKQLILVGATADQNNILPNEEGKDGGGGIIADGSEPCPSSCPTDPNDPLT